ncbi:F-box protein PP2-B15-like [Nicotiana tabacum]|uniref:F-box protein PP2-B15-like n=2 Tax=Nicotiana TaxID=4085 RepID=A0A1S4B312_TOBAC|nr:PREDICTED: F-box protein PP2-B15-like [Nicotiana sylvestris]XP_016483330.1 PREDICTED: F-box protein PP2-B15-like [Nicotiana tabacum]
MAIDESEIMKLDLLPEDCIVQVLSFTSPHDACHASLVSTMVRDAAISDLLWEKFLPSDYRQIISRLVLPINFASKKELFLKLFNPLLIDGGRKTFSIDRISCKKCYILSARELSIAWSTNPLYWCWKPLLRSRFPEGVELIMVCWLEIKGTINTRMLSPRTTYGAYLIVNLAGRAFGLESLPSEVSVKVGGDQESKGIVYLRRNYANSRKQELERVIMRHRVETLRSRVDNRGGKERALTDREDGWLEIELGEFYSDGVNDKEVTMCLREVKGEHLKGGLIVEGIELRPK